MIKSIEKIPPFYLVIINFGIVAVLGVIDYLSGEEFSFYMFYFFPIIIISWYVGKKIGYSFAIVCILAWLIAKTMNHHFYSNNFVFVSNALMRFSVFFIVAFLMSKIKSSSIIITELDQARQREKTVAETMQKMVSIIAETITINNSEIINWVDTKKRNGQQAPEKVEKASRVIGKSMRALTEVCFDTYDDKNQHIDFIQKLKKRIEDIENSAGQENNKL